MIDWQAKRDSTGVLILLELAESLGLDQPNLLAKTELQLEVLEQPLAVVANWQELQLLRNILGQGVDAVALGLANARQYRPERVGPLSAAMQACETLAEALEFSRQCELLGLSFSQISALQEGADLRIYVDSSWLPLDCAAFCQVRGVASSLQALRDLLKRPVAVSRLSLQANAQERHEILDNFFDCPIEYGASETCLTVSAEILQSTLPLANKKIKLINQDYCQLLLRHLQQQQSFVSQLKQKLGSAPWRIPLSEAAVLMSCSERSFRRRLQAEGISYRELLLESRMQAARHLLSSGKGVSKTAIALGYSEVAGFSRAYKKHWGRSASQDKKLATP